MVLLSDTSVYSINVAGDILVVENGYGNRIMGGGGSDDQGSFMRFILYIFRIDVILELE